MRAAETTEALSRRLRPRAAGASKEKTGLCRPIESLPNMKKGPPGSGGPRAQRPAAAALDSALGVLRAALT
jgi:hypothetical protein